jgi:hypothetical protein
MVIAWRLAMRRLLLLSLAMLWLGTMTTAAPPLQQETARPEQSISTNPVRRAQMAGHYRAVTVVYIAVIRGDLGAARDAAIALWGMAPPAGVPAGAVPIAEWVQLQGKRAAQATSLGQAAEAVAGMLTLCGDCHRTVGIRAGTDQAPRSEVGGIVGHMLEHQQAVEALAEGLVAPSPSRWQEGADLLQRAPLASSDLPPDSGLSTAVRRVEADVHAIAANAASVSNNTARTSVFASLIETCSNCHRLHRQVWGPGGDRP